MILRLMIGFAALFWALYIIYRYTPEKVIVLSKIMLITIDGNIIRNENGNIIYTADHNIMHITSDGQIVASSYMYSSKRTARTFDDRIVAVCSNSVHYVIITVSDIDGSYKIYLYDSYTDTNLAIMTYSDSNLEIFSTCSVRQGKVIVPLKRSTIIFSPVAGSYVEIIGNTIYTDQYETIIRDGLSSFKLTDNSRSFDNSVPENLVARYGDFKILEDSGYSLWYKNIAIHTDIEGPFFVSYHNGSFILNNYIYRSHLDIERTDCIFCMV